MSARCRHTWLGSSMKPCSISLLNRAPYLELLSVHMCAAAGASAEATKHFMLLLRMAKLRYNNRDRLRPQAYINEHAADVASL